MVDIWKSLRDHVRRYGWCWVKWSTVAEHSGKSLCRFRHLEIIYQSASYTSCSRSHTSTTESGRTTCGRSHQSTSNSGGKVHFNILIVKYFRNITTYLHMGT